ncbi:MAG: MerR family transcriptional regulator [Rhodospirillaceae bacterium]
MGWGACVRLATGRWARVKVVTIRYYESVGLLPPPPRTEGNRRFYGQADVDRLVFIRRSREFGLSSEAIKSLLTLALNQNNPVIPQSKSPRNILRRLNTGFRNLMPWQDISEAFSTDALANA